MKFSWFALLITILITLLLAHAIQVWNRGLTQTTHSIASVPFWQSFASPGPLAEKHNQLENNCSACHTPVTGVMDANCIVCHAEMERLLNREATVFHANIANCKACHREHQGRMARISEMDHNRYAKIGLKFLKTNIEIAQSDSFSEPMKFVKNIQSVQPPETALNCLACHRTEDLHYGYFGDECIACHTTRTWSLPRYLHPAESSRDCAQCHKAPPNHWMSMFKDMMPDGRQRMGRISDCYLCHTIKSWDDIKGMSMHRAMHEPIRDE